MPRVARATHYDAKPIVAIPVYLDSRKTLEEPPDKFKRDSRTGIAKTFWRKDKLLLELPVAHRKEVF